MFDQLPFAVLYEAHTEHAYHYLEHSHNHGQQIRESNDVKLDHQCETTLFLAYVQYVVSELSNHGSHDQ